MQLKFINLKLLFTLLALAIISTQTMALEGQGFKIISEKIESSPGTKGGFIPMATTKHNFKSFGATTSAHAYNSSGRVHENIKLSSQHGFSINNRTKQTQLYDYKYELNCDGQFFRKTDRIQVAAGGYVSDAAVAFLYTVHSNSGSWPINAVSSVSGESHDNTVSIASLRVTS